MRKPKGSEIVKLLKSIFEDAFCLYEEKGVCKLLFKVVLQHSHFDSCDKIINYINISVTIS